MWVCSHEDHEQWVMVTCWPTASGDWIVPIDTVMYTRGVGAVGRLAPEFPNGGPAPTKSPFVPVP